ncbi:hypothetical protein PROFUN_09364 [Planoprotostelium fungivorum]|uniref:DH domain-containing protein n=1 Tax=Planoprotostelium fungivorum TaxID=1890364 RepID=A0A2P6NGW5_9EUKA|nr:hypothetical protein PROFUN_09364 [Planoprotostelium fungivorum]
MRSPAVPPRGQHISSRGSSLVLLVSAFVQLETGFLNFSSPNILNRVALSVYIWAPIPSVSQPPVQTMASAAISIEGHHSLRSSKESSSSNGSPKKGGGLKRQLGKAMDKIAKSLSVSAKSIDLPDRGNQVNVCLVGLTCGKTTLTARLKQAKGGGYIVADETHNSTVLSTFHHTIHGRKIEFSVLELPGSDFEFVDSEHAAEVWKWADVIALCFSVTEATTFLSLPIIQNNISSILGDFHHAIVVGLQGDDVAADFVSLNRSADEQGGRTVTKEMGKEYARENDLSYIEVSAQTGHHIPELLESIWDIFSTSEAPADLQDRSWTMSPTKWSPRSQKVYDFTSPLADAEMMDEPIVSRPRALIVTDHPYRLSDEDKLIEELEERIEILKNMIHRLSQSPEKFTSLGKTMSQCLSEKILLEDQLRVMRIKSPRKSSISTIKLNGSWSHPEPGTDSSGSSPNRSPRGSPKFGRSRRVSKGGSFDLSMPRNLVPLMVRMQLTDDPCATLEDLDRQLREAKESLHKEERRANFLRANGETGHYEEFTKSLLTRQESIRKLQIRLREKFDEDFDAKKWPEEEIHRIIVCQSIIRGRSARRKAQIRAKMHAKRGHIFRELVETEKAYVSSMQQIIHKYVLPLRKSGNDENPVVSRDDQKFIFADIEIIHAWHLRLLRDMQERIQTQQSNTLSVYTAFTNNLDTAMQKIREYLSSTDYLQWLMEQQCNTDHLESLLITPVQRVPRYVLLFTDLKNSTWPTHRDYQGIEQLISVFASAASNINEKKRDSEHARRVFDISSSLLGDRKVLSGMIAPHRRYVCDSEVRGVAPDGRTRGRRLFLFNDLLLIAKDKQRRRGDSFINTGSSPGTSPTLGDSNYEYEQNLSLSGMMVLDHEEGADNLFEIVAADSCVLLSAESKQVKTMWIEQLNSFIKKQDTLSHFQAEQNDKAAQARADKVKDMIRDRYNRGKLKPTECKSDKIVGLRSFAREKSVIDRSRSLDGAFQRKLNYKRLKVSVDLSADKEYEPIERSFVVRSSVQIWFYDTSVASELYGHYQWEEYVAASQQ